MKTKEAELTINKLLHDYLTQLKSSQVFFVDLTEGQVKKVIKAVDKYQGKLEKLQKTLVKQLSA